MAQVTLEQLTADTWVVSLLGEHDISMVDALRDRLAEALTRDGRLIIDLTEATFVDSTVLGVLFAVVNQSTSAAAGETRALVVTPGSTVDRTIALAGLTSLVATYPSRDQVLAAWREDGHHTHPDPRTYQQRG
jgi:anti-sigma B factor antagonist